MQVSKQGDLDAQIRPASSASKRRRVADRRLHLDALHESSGAHLIEESPPPFARAARRRGRSPRASRGCRPRSVPLCIRRSVAFVGRGCSTARSQSGQACDADCERVCPGWFGSLPGAAVPESARIMASSESSLFATEGARPSACSSRRRPSSELFSTACIALAGAAGPSNPTRTVEQDL